MAELPSGTVTFLFTDLEGSTRLWEQHPDAARLALARHNILLRHALETHGGHIFGSGGDSFAVAFASASDAVAATVAAQRALQAESWGKVGLLRVRMALHTGLVDPREDNYSDPVVNHVARLVGIGHGGQILLSQSSCDLTRDHLPEDICLRDLGEHRLKDLARPMRIFQVVTPDLPSDFPPLKTLDRRDTARALRVISREILSQLDPDAIVAQLTGELPAVFPAKSAALFLLDAKNGTYRQAGVDTDALTLPAQESSLILSLRQSGRPVGAGTPSALEDLALRPSDGQVLRRLKAVLWLPLTMQGRLVGTLALGEKASEELYTEEEVEALCLVANEAALALELAELSAERERQARLQQEITIARSIQVSLLSRPQLRLQSFEILSRSEPSTEVGGDFYNLFELRGQEQAGSSTPHRLGVLLGDVAGKGVSAALFMAVTTTLIQAQAQFLRAPAATLAAANAELYPKMHSPQQGRPRFVTALYGLLDPASGEIRLASAGQTPPILWPASSEPRYLPLKGLPLGALPAPKYEETVIRLAPGDRLIFCSDGFIEEQSAAGEPVGYDGFLRRLAALVDQTGSELIEALFGRDAAGRAAPVDRDDRTLVLITAL